MAYKVIILYRLYMPPYFLGTFTEYPEFHQIPKKQIPQRFIRTSGGFFFSGISTCFLSVRCEIRI